MKLHLLLDHNGHLPAFGVVSEGKKHEIQVAREMDFTPGTTLVIDRGYTDYQWFVKLTQRKVDSATRMKENADYGVVEKRELPNRPGVLRDEVIFFFKLAEQDVECFFRRIESTTRSKSGYAVLTNNLVWSAATIAALYKQRWQVELFFKALKQNLKVKTFVGTSANALKIQIWTALIAMLLIKYLQLQATFGWSLSVLVALLRQQLFVYRDLWIWLNDPFQPPPILTELPEQLTLQLG